MPKSVKELLVKGEHQNKNFVESFKSLNIRKEAEYCLPAAFQFWALPKVKKLLDEKINLFIFGREVATGNTNKDPFNHGMLIMSLPQKKKITS